MRFVIVGGSGLVGSTLVATLRARGHEAVPRITGHGRRHAHSRKVPKTDPIELNVQALAAAGATT
jgi:uncharacterized protein YbjT (DUF2867 family)